MGWTHSDLTQQAQGSPPPAVFGPSAYAFDSPQTMNGEITKHVVFQGFPDNTPDRQIHELWAEPGGKWQHTKLSQDSGAGAASLQPAGYVYASEGTQHAIYLGDPSDQSTAGHLLEIWWTGSDKNSNDLTNVVGTHLANPPAGYDFGDQTIVFEGVDSHIYILVRGPEGDWGGMDLSKKKGAPAALGQPTAFFSLNPFQKNVVFTGSDGNVWRFFGLGMNWTLENVTAQSGRVPKATDPPFGFFVPTDPISGRENVIIISYRGTDGNLYQLTRTAEGWQPGSSLSATIQTPLATPGTIPTGYVFPYEGTLHINYAGVDGNIHEFWAGSGGWAWNNLTFDIGAPLAISNPSAYVFNADNTQHVVYTAAGNHHIIELEWSP